MQLSDVVEVLMDVVIRRHLYAFLIHRGVMAVRERNETCVGASKLPSRRGISGFTVAVSDEDSCDSRTEVHTYRSAPWLDAI